MVSPFSRDQTTLVSGSFFELRLSRISLGFFDDRRPLRSFPSSLSLFPETFPEASASLLAERNGVKSAAKNAIGFPEIRNIERGGSKG
jgi:hypothetical protein